MPEPRTHYGKVLSVEPRLGTLRVDFDLGFGVRLSRLVDIEGVAPDMVDERHRNAVQHCLVVLLVGRRVILRTRQIEGRTIARVYVADVIKTPPDDEATMVRVPGTDHAVLAVGPFLRWLSVRNYRASLVAKVLNGKYYAAA